MLGSKLIKAAAGNVGAGGANPYIEDVFSTHLYTGTGSAQPITNGIALGDSNVGGSVYFGDTAGYPLMFDSAISLTSDCTVEFFIYRRVSGGSGECIFSPDYGSTGVNRQMGIVHNTGYLYVYDGTSKVGSGASVPLGAWRHVAFSKSGSTVYFWVNGVSGGSITSSLFSIVGMGNLMGYALASGPDAWISNLRISNTARYTSAFTAPTSALTSDANTILLALQGDDPFVDQTSNYTLTPYTVSAAKFGPFTGSGVGEGGLVWIKQRSAANIHTLYDTERGVQKYLSSALTSAQTTNTDSLTAFNSDGFSIGSAAFVNGSGATTAAWTFRKAPKFFDVVTYTGTGSARTVAHNLGSVPGCIIVKRTNGVTNWMVYHRSTGNDYYLMLNSTGAAGGPGNTTWNLTDPTDTEFSVSSASSVNDPAGTYVAYLFAHDAGGFGDDGEQNVISCGSYTGNGSTTGTVVNLGWEPQWVMIKGSDLSATNWLIFDSMRGVATNGTDYYLLPNASDAEGSGIGDALDFNATGFQLKSTNGQVNNSGTTYTYIAIRRGPMKTPTSGAEVFNPVANSLAINSTTPVSLTPEASDLWLSAARSGTFYFLPRLAGWRYTTPTSTAAEVTSYTWTQRTQSELLPNTTWFSTSPQINYFFKRHPGFFDVVCYTGTGVARTVDHNLGVVPEMMIVKRRDTTGDWQVYHQNVSADPETDVLVLNGTGAFVDSSTRWNDTLPTDSVFTVGTNATVNGSGGTYVAYLFATLAGVSKVGGYTGTGTTLQVNCGFSAGARFVLIKRTDSTGDWYVWDSARGIVSGNDPYLLMNSTAAEVTSTDYIDPYSAGFEISSTAPAAINASGGNFIFLAIA